MMPMPLKEHPLRHAVTAELHARMFDPLCAPAQLIHLATICGERGSGRNVRHLLRLLDLYGAPPPDSVGQYYTVDLGGIRLRWERHTEFVTYTFSRQGPFERPFARSLLDDMPEEWVRDLPGEIIAATSLVLESSTTPQRSHEELLNLFEGNPYIGSEVAGGAACAWSDQRIHSDGYSRILIHDRNLSEYQAGRLAKRILELNAYRAIALLGLPEARAINKDLSAAEQRLVSLAAGMAAQNNGNSSTSENDLLAELTCLATEIEELAARTIYRFEASRAYYHVVRQRLEQLRQKRIEGLQTFSEFLETRLSPAIATCDSTRERQQDLAVRAARLTDLLQARVEVDLQNQNRRLLESMDRRARIQLRLQETVEGLSVIAIGYYGVGLVGYVLKGLEAHGLPIDATFGMGVSVPIVVATAWLGLRRMKKHLLASHSG